MKNSLHKEKLRISTKSTFGGTALFIGARDEVTAFSGIQIFGKVEKISSACHFETIYAWFLCQFMQKWCPPAQKLPWKIILILIQHVRSP